MSIAELPFDSVHRLARAACIHVDSSTTRNEKTRDKRDPCIHRITQYAFRDITWTPSSWEKAPRDAARRCGLLGLQEENASTDLSSASISAVFGYNKAWGVSLQDRKKISRIRTKIAIHLFPLRLIRVHALVPAPSLFLLPTFPPVIHSLVIDPCNYLQH